MARRRKSRRRRHARRAKSSKGSIKKLLLLAGLGFGLYMVMKPLASAPLIAKVDGQPAPLSIVTDADLQKMFSS